MRVFISGGAKCGKSSYAQDLALNLADGGKHYYVATMIPTGREDDERIRRHLLDREGMGFETVECFQNLLELTEKTDPEGTFLIDNVTSLMQNALFHPENNYEPDLHAAKRCVDEMAAFAGKVRNAVFVSDYIYADAQRYSESTELYRKCLADADRVLSGICDVVMEVTASHCIVHKGELP